MKYLAFWAALAVANGPAWAADVALKPIIDIRARYEFAEQDGLPRDATAVTTRVRAGVQATAGRWSALAEAEGSLAVSERYNSGLNGKAAFPIVADPQTVELNRLQLQYAQPGATITVGRQRINHDDQRFVGSVAWRNNEQTFDAARLEMEVLPALKADIAYSWSVRTIWGIDGAGARPQAISGDNVLARLDWTMPLGTLSGFAYLVDQDEAAVSGFRLSSQTVGARLKGSRPLGGATDLTYLLSYARQSDWHRNPNDYSADYWQAELGVDIGGLKLSGGYEVLGADDGVALTSFQTPLATAHKFQGWADKFLTTPPDGIRDLHAGVGYGWKRVGPFDAIAVSAIHHRFHSDRGDEHYGDETNLIATARRGKWAFLVKYADYRAKDFATDSRRLWASVEWAF